MVRHHITKAAQATMRISRLEVLVARLMRVLTPRQRQQMVDEARGDQAFQELVTRLRGAHR